MLLGITGHIIQIISESFLIVPVCGLDALVFSQALIASVHIFVMVHTENIHHIVARIAAEILRAVDFRVRRIRPQDVPLTAFLFNIVSCQCKERLVLRTCAQVAAPPEPASDVLVPRPENQWDKFAVSIFHGTEKVCDT